MAETTMALMLAAGSGGIPLGGFATAASVASAAGTGFSLLQGFGVLSSIVGGAQQSQALKMQANQDNLNAQLEKVKAEDQANQIRRTLISNISTQNAGFAARGIGLGSGTPEQAKAVSADNASKDIEKAQFGGNMAALDYRVQAAQDKANAGSAFRSGIANAALSLGSSRNGLKSLVSF